MHIKSIRIKNFRSIKDDTLHFKRLNIFVGNNDAGKSNIIRALHLFFANESQYPFNWIYDYCRFAKKYKKKAPQIDIEVVILPPSNFKDQRSIIWSKSWRKDGFHSESISHEDGKPITRQNKASYLLKTVRFDYVPAIRSELYFSGLLASLYEMLKQTVQKEIETASSSFTKVINTNTAPIIKDIMEQLNLKSEIAPPADLRGIFEALDFISTHSGENFSLQQRGDGIKARHIPIILNWLANQARTLSAPGRPKIATIWGYEEPENNLEMSACFDSANTFLEHSKRTQTFITTHSPAFYSLILEDNDERVAVFGVTKSAKNDEPISKFRKITKDGLESVDDSMGLMPLIALRLKPIQDELERVKKIKQQLPTHEKPVLFVEGTTDKIVLETILKHAASALDIHIEAGDYKDGCANWVADRIIAWSYLQPASKPKKETKRQYLSRLAIGLFDPDEAGDKARMRCSKDIKCNKSLYAKTIKLATSRELKELKSKGFDVSVGLEELYAENVWKYAETKGWLVDREDLLTAYKFNDPSKSFETYLDEKNLTSHERKIVIKKINPTRKGKLANYVKNLSEEDLSCTIANFKFTIEEIGRSIK